MARTTNVRSIGDRGATPAAAAPQVDEKVLERAAEATSRMGRADRVFYWDKRQAAQVWANESGQPLSIAQLEPDALADSLALISGGTIAARNRHHLVQSPEVLVCGHDRSHGRLTMHGQGSILMCTAHKGGAPCTYTQPVSV